MRTLTVAAEGMAERSRSMLPLSTISRGLQWRAHLLLLKLAGRMSSVPWRLLRDEICRRRELAWTFPQVTLIEEDVENGFRLLEIDGHQYWVSADVCADHMQGAHKEIFCRQHPHHYEHAGCRVSCGDIVLDAGACEGLFTRFALLKGARVIVCEPSSKTAEGLRRTYADEIKAGRVVVEQVALSDECGSATLWHDPAHPEAASVHHVHTNGLQCEQVEAITIDALVQRSPWKRCNFIKMDVEGSERSVVRGAVETLRRDRPCLSIAVYHIPSGFLDIQRDLRIQCPYFRTAGKGIMRGLDEVLRPWMLHAWENRLPCRVPE
jgi:FkbM family methyltransferase